MKILLTGNGGRENAIAWKIFNSDSFKRASGKLFAADGNPGISGFAEIVKIKPADIKSLVEFSKKEKIDFIVTGSEIPLSLGITDEFEKNGFKIFGPSKAAAEIETSKVFAKGLMEDNGIPTAKYRMFTSDEFESASDFLNSCSYPVVFKADGLAAGKGVIIAKDFAESIEAVKNFCEGRILKDSGSKFILEEFIAGEEISVFAVTDGGDYVILPFSQDHKREAEGETGRNTGGMGAVAPVEKYMTDEMTQKIKSRIIDPVLKAMKKLGREFKGCLYCGLIISENEPYVIEFNCRFGDPETQSVLPLIKSDFLELLISSAEKNIRNYKLEINNEYSCCVVLASGGYPGKYETGKIVSGIENTGNDCIVFHSGTEFSGENKTLITNGGRVISVVGVSENSLNEAVKIAYDNSAKINFENKYFRKDIGFRQIKNQQ